MNASLPSPTPSPASGSPDPLAALRDIQSPLDRAEACASAAIDLYWQQHDLPSAAAALLMGIQTIESLLPAEGPDPQAPTFQLLIALNHHLANFTCPGWGEPEITIPPSLREQGTAAAAQHLELTLLAHPTPPVEARARWLLGAHALARGECTTAENLFLHAARIVAPAPSSSPPPPLSRFLHPARESSPHTPASSTPGEAESLFYEACAALAQLLSPLRVPAGTYDPYARYQGILERLVHDEEAAHFLHQLETAREFLQSSRPAAQPAPRLRMP